MVWLEGGSICLLDWEPTGFYPKLSEVCLQRIRDGLFGDFNRIFLESMPPLTEGEERQAVLISEAFSNGQKYGL